MFRKSEKYKLQIKQKLTSKKQKAKKKYIYILEEGMFFFSTKYLKYLKQTKHNWELTI